MNILSELLRKLMLDEKKVMNNNPVKHPTLIGNMYEGATKKILKKIDFSHPDLKVVSGIITSGDNHSGQIDCMVVMMQDNFRISDRLHDYHLGNLYRKVVK